MKVLIRPIRPVFVLLIVVAFLLAGCEPQDTENSIELKVVDADGYKQAIAQHRGKVVLVDFWATWCTHCVKQFPHTVKLHQDHATEGLAVVSVSMDDEADKEDALKMLRKFGATFDNLLGGNESLEAFGIESGLPSYQLYDRKGELRHTFADTDPDKPLSTDDIDAAVRELLAEK